MGTAIPVSAVEEFIKATASGVALVRSLGLGVVLFALWFLLSGHTEPFLLALGVASCALVVFVTHRMDVIDREGFPIDLGLGAVFYWPWLGWEIVKANIDVAKVVLSPSLPISPTMFRVPTTQKTEVGQVTYANSITLTPGTITVDIVDGMLEVHALTREAADGLETGEMDRRVTAMEGRGGASPAQESGA